MDIYLNLIGCIDEYKLDDFKDENEVKKINSYVQDELQYDCQKLLEYMQEIDSDPIGIGDMVRAKTYFLLHLQITLLSLSLVEFQVFLPKVLPHSPQITLPAIGLSTVA